MGQVGEKARLRCAAWIDDGKVIPAVVLQAQEFQYLLIGGFGVAYVIFIQEDLHAILASQVKDTLDLGSIASRAAVIEKSVITAFGGNMPVRAPFHSQVPSLLEVDHILVALGQQDIVKAGKLRKNLLKIQLKV